MLLLTLNHDSHLMQRLAILLDVVLSLTSFIRQLMFYLIHFLRMVQRPLTRLRLFLWWRTMVFVDQFLRLQIWRFRKLEIICVLLYLLERRRTLIFEQNLQQRYQN